VSPSAWLGILEDRKTWSLPDFCSYVKERQGFCSVCQTQSVQCWFKVQATIPRIHVHYLHQRQNFSLILNIQASSGAHPAPPPIKWIPGVLSGVKRLRSAMTTDLHLVPRLHANKWSYTSTTPMSYTGRTLPGSFLADLKEWTYHFFSQPEDGSRFSLRNVISNTPGHWKMSKTLSLLVTSITFFYGFQKAILPYDTWNFTSYVRQETPCHEY